MSRQLPRLLSAAALAGVFVLGSTTSALAADDASIAHVETSSKGLQVLVSVPENVAVDLDNISVTVDGQPAESQAVLATANTDVRRTTVLVIDTSNSMRGQRFESAKTAAETFLDAVPDDVYVGIVSFADQVSEPLAPSLDRDRAREVISELALSKHTRLYDGVLAGVRMAGADGQRSLVVLSDGADTTETVIGDVTSAVSDAEVLVDIVSLEESGEAPAPLQTLAEAGSGQVIQATPEALQQTFSQEAESLARQVLVTAQVPDSVTATEATIEVQLPTDAGSLSVRAFTTVQDAAPAPPSDQPSAARDAMLLPAWAMYAGVGALGFGLLLIIAVLAPRRGARRLSAEDRVKSYTERLDGKHAGPASGRMDTDQALAQVTDAAAGVLRRSGSLEARISARLESAGSPLKSSEWLLVHVGIAVGSLMLGLLIGKGSAVTTVIFVALGILVPWLYLGRKRSKRRKAFNRSLPDTLQLMSGSLAAGLSLTQSADTIVKEGVEPIASEFKRVLVETRLGVPLEEALDDVAVRFDSKDFAWTVMAIRIQRQVGGNLAELLENVASTMREREYMRRQVAALSAEGRLSAWILGGLPPGFLVYLVLVNREYVMPIFTDPRGWVMLGGAAVWLTVGVFWMSKLVKVEV